MHRLRTLDVWDTLLRRRCHPDLIKLSAARYLQLGRPAALRPQWRDHWALMRERCLIEGELAREAAAAGRDDEYTLEAVLARLVARTLELPEEAQPAVVAELMAAELALEKSNTFADPECRRLLDAHPAGKSLFLSDFYMPATMIAELLEHHGLADLAPVGLSSCDVGLNKRSGKLFRHVHALFELKPEEHVHIGDNRHSDVDVPAALGVRSVHYLPEAPHAERQQRERLFPDRPALFAHIGQAIADEAGPVAETLADAARAAFLLGTRCAPLLVGYALFTAERAIADRAERLYFFTREGEFFIRVFRAVLPAASLAGHRLPPAGLLEVSRLATFAASLQGIDTQELMRLWNLYSTQSMTAFAKSLGLAPELIEPACRRYDIDPAQPVIYPWQDERVQRLFADDEFRALLETHVAGCRERLLGYLGDHALDESVRSLAIVDIGWRGTIQDNLALLLPQRTLHGYYMGLARFLNPQPANTQKCAYGPDLNHSLEHSHFLDAVSPLEMLCNSPNGSTVGYRHEADGSVAAIRHVDEDENRVHHDFVRHFQHGVLLAAGHWGRYADSHAIAAAELRDEACRIWDMLLSRSPQELSDAYAALSHNELFGVGGFVDKSAVPSPATLLRGVMRRRERDEVILYLKQTQWRSGLWRRKDLGLLHKCMLSAALTGGKLYKHLRLRRRQARAGRH